jgi:hypothetical protein
VVTVTVAEPLPEGNETGLTEQVVAFATTGREQDKLTWAEKPLWAATEIAFVNVAVWPAETVWEIAPEEVMAKSGGGVTVMLKGRDIPPG